MARKAVKQAEPSALDRVQNTVKRVQSGVLAPKAGQAIIEAYAAALPVELYDLAVDSIAAVAEANGSELQRVKYPQASKREQTRDRRDADTRRAVRRAAKFHRPAAGAGVESNSALRIQATDPRAISPWFGPVEEFRVAAWAVASDGTVEPLGRTEAMRSRAVRTMPQCDRARLLAPSRLLELAAIRREAAHDNMTPEQREQVASYRRRAGIHAHHDSARARAILERVGVDLDRVGATA